MYLLAIETTGAFASVALLQAGEGGDCQSRVLGCIHGNDRFSHLQNLTPQIAQLLEKNALQIGDLSAIAVSSGPGSFTGIRIGVSTTRALAQILDLPCVPVSSLEALALRAGEAEAAAPVKDADPAKAVISQGEGDTGVAGSPLICPILDARRQQVYGGGYFLREGGIVCAVEAGCYQIRDFLEQIRSYPEVIFLGDGIDTCGALIREIRPEGTVFAVKACRYQDAAAVALRGWQLLQAGQSREYLQLEPNYMRMAEAEKKLREKQAREAAHG